MRVRAVGGLPAAPERAWAVLVAWERQAEWMSDADRVTVLGSRREGIGTRVEVRTRLLGIPAFTEILEVVAWDPPRSLDIRHTGIVMGEGRWRLSPIPGAGTEFAWEEEVRLRLRPGGEVAARIYRPVMRRLMRRAIGRLAALIEVDGQREAT